MVLIKEKVSEVVMHHGLAWIQCTRMFQQLPRFREPSLTEPDDREVQIHGCESCLSRDRAIEQLFGLLEIIPCQIKRRKVGQRRRVIGITPQDGLVLQNRVVRISYRLIQNYKIELQKKLHGALTCCHSP